MANQFFIPHFRGPGSPGSPGVGTTQAAILKNQQTQEQNRLRSVITAASNISNMPTDEAKLAALLTRREDLAASGTPTQDTDELIGLFQSGRTDEANALINGAVDAGIQQGLLKSPRDIRGQASSVKTFAPIADPTTGELGLPTFDPTTGKAEFKPIPGAPVQQTPEQKQAAEIAGAQKEADIAVKEAERKEINKQRIQRASAIKTELSERNRSAARSSRTLRQALTLAQQADQGLTGTAKLQLSRLLPGIDAGDEAALDATLNQLALEQLQLFKGPTTDFEFGVTQSIAGDLGNSKEANISRVKSLDRARWFNEKEFKQFNKHIASGGDADSFSFNFGEPVKTKKGVFTLQDIQDTAVENNLTIEETIKRLNQ